MKAQMDDHVGFGDQRVDGCPIQDVAVLVRCRGGGDARSRDAAGWKTPGRATSGFDCPVEGQGDDLPATSPIVGVWTRTP
jgi:hypothetical protein